MQAESHIKAFEEHKKVIYEWVLDIVGIESGQRTVGLHASRAVIELLNAYLHEAMLLPIEAQLNHRWFKSEKRAVSYLPDFPEKHRITTNLVELENICERLAYGKPRPAKETERAIEILRDLEASIQKLRQKG